MEKLSTLNQNSRDRATSAVHTTKRVLILWRKDKTSAVHTGRNTDI